MILLDTVEATHRLGVALGAQLIRGDVIALHGPLGAGKTVLARGILSGLGYDGDVPSPSFPIVIPYNPPAVRLSLAHIDLYRIENSHALPELGLDEARGDGALVIEWAERLGARAWEDMLELSLEVLPDGARRLTAKVPPAWGSRWPLR